MIAIGASADQLDAEADAEAGAHLGAERGGTLDGQPGAQPGAKLDAQRGGASPEGPDVRRVLGEVRRIVSAADSRGRGCEWIGDLATERVRDFAEFELLHARATRHLERRDLDAADAEVVRLVALERVLLSPEVAEMVEALKFQLLVARG